MRTRKTWKRLLLALVCILMFSIPVFASAKTVAKIGSKKYSSLEAAIKKVKNGQTIKLQCNVTLKKNLVLNRNVKYTINLNRKKITMKNCTGIDLKKGKVTLYNGTISTSMGLFVGKKAALTVKKGTFKFTFMNHGTMTVSGGTVTTIHNDGMLTMKSGKITHGIWCDGKSRLYVKGGTVTQDSGAWGQGAITVKAGYKTLSVTGGKVRGTTADWPAIMIVDKKSSKPKIKEKYVTAKSGMKIGFVYEIDNDGYLEYGFY